MGEIEDLGELCARPCACQCKDAKCEPNHGNVRKSHMRRDKRDSPGSMSERRRELLRPDIEAKGVSTTLDPKYYKMGGHELDQSRGHVLQTAVMTRLSQAHNAQEIVRGDEHAPAERLH